MTVTIQLHATRCQPNRHRCRGKTEGFSTVSGESGWGLPPSGEGPQAERKGGGGPVIGVSAELGKMEGVGLAVVEV